MSLGTFLHTCVVDAKAGAHRALELLARLVPAIDAAAPAVEAITAAFDPAAALYEKALVSVFDEAASVILANATPNPDGTITLTLTPTTVAAARQAIADAQNWKAQAKA